MDKKNLQSILSAPFTIPNWRDVLVSVFGAKRLHQNPIPIVINKKEKAEAAFELGSFNTSDDRIMGLYLVKVKPEVWIERNKVGLREMLRSVYKHDVDGALIVFEQKDKWRLSFVSEIRVFDENGKISKKTTEPKRYTYLLGAGEKVITPATRLASLSGKPFSLEDIRNAFSVEALNEEFYRVVAKYFYQLVGATEGKGEKAVTHPRILELPGIKPDNNEGHKIYQEFAVRLIGRTVFCWFLKVKKSENGIALLAEHLLSSEAVASNNHYYHFILEKLFFQTLNTPMDERIKGLPKGCEQIPFLNGGLFEPQTEDYYKPNSSGLSGNLNTLVIPDSWFKDFFEHLEQYNFTIDENSVVDIEVSVDPEMLGRIFENLLAEIDPDSGETARKATGSFYTPREIVDYMATESLVLYLHNQTKIDKENLHPIFKMDSEVSFSKPEAEKILEALDRLKILDPACGSGAFPIGVMQKIVMALQKLDKEAVWWKAKQIQRIENAILRKQVKQKLEQTTVEYARKIGIIQNSLYGVDIQPIAAEISKLRCFLTLVVDENIDETKPNRGVEPLPNLEFKFVTADALLKLPPETKDHGTGDLFSNANELNELQQIRLDYLQSYGEHKEELKQRFLDLQKAIFKQQLKYGAKENSRAYQISSWNPFGHDKVDWFDPLWMYGISEFDIVIGNPPYGTSVKGNYRKSIESNLGKVPDYEIYYYFIEKSKTVLSEKGILSYIIPNTYLFNTFAENYRKQLLNDWNLSEVLDCTNFPIFKTAVVRNTINTWSRGVTSVVGYRNTKGKNTFERLVDSERLNITKEQLNLYIQNWGLAFSLDKNAFAAIVKIKSNTKSLETFFSEISQGLIAYDKYQGQSEEIIKNRTFHFTEKTKPSLKPWLWGGDVNRYSVVWNGKEYIDYCDGIANPRDPKFFKGKRILVREITNPSVFAAYSDSELYNDPAIIIILDNKSESLFALLGILNSRLATFFHFNNSPKATKGAFPKILVKDIREFPLRSDYKNRSIQVLVSYILFVKGLKDSESLNEYVPNSHVTQTFEEVIDALVYELYFEDDFRAAKIKFMNYAERDFKSIEGKSEKDAVKIIHDAYQTLREKDNEIRQNLKLMDTRLADLIMPIKTTK